MTEMFKIDSATGKRVRMTAAEIAGLNQMPDAPGPTRPLSREQLAIVLMRRGAITPAQAEEFAASGTIPAAMMAAINAALEASIATPEEQAEIRITLRGARHYRRTDSYVPLIGTALGLDAAGLDALWAEGARL